MTIPIIYLKNDNNNINGSNDKEVVTTTTRIIAKEVGKACQEIGFFAVINHGVDQTVLDRAWNASTDFFDLESSEKMQYKTWNESEYPYGYEQSEKLTLGKKKEMMTKIDDKDDGDRTIPISETTDLKETFSIGPSNPDAGMPPRRFPKEPLEFQSALEDYYVEMEKLTKRLLKIFAIALDLDENWFDDKMTHHLSALRILNYYQVDLSSSQQEPGMLLRAGEHTDYGVLTILKSGGPGLQVKKDNSSNSTKEEDDCWVDVPTIPNAFIINIGDMMQRWTNDKWVSTLHRVIVVPTNEATEGKNSQKLVAPRRQSMAFFCNVNGDTLVTPLETCCGSDGDVVAANKKYPPITARQHIMNKHLASMGLRSSLDHGEADDNNNNNEDDVPVSSDHELR